MNVRGLSGEGHSNKSGGRDLRAGESSSPAPKWMILDDLESLQ